MYKKGNRILTFVFSFIFFLFNTVNPQLIYVAHAESTQFAINILNNTSLGLSTDKKRAMAEMADALLAAGYESAFVAGVLGNIKYEGTCGRFEDSGYSSNEPVYLLYMDQNYNYRNEYSNQNIAGKSLSKVYSILCELSSKGILDSKHAGFGLGCIQWSFDRAKALVETYISVANGKDSIDTDQIIHAEALYIVKEFNGKYHSVYTDWLSANANNLSSPTSANSAGRSVCIGYVKPNDMYTKQYERGDMAQIIYEVCVGENPLPKKWPDDYTPANLGNSFDAIILSSKFRKPIRPDNSSTSNVVLYQEEWKNCEMWRFTRQSNGSYKIENFGNGYCLDANRHGTEDGTNISTVASNDYEAQRWFLYAAKDGYIFRPAYCDLAMDISEQKSADNTNIHLWTYHGGDSQIFVVYRNLNGKDVNNYAKPTPPVPTLTVESESAITVSWSQTMYTEKYVVYRSIDNSNWTKLGETTSFSYKDTGLSSGKKYYYKYESVSRFYKETSPSASATTKAPQTVTIKLDGNGGTVSKASFAVEVGSKLDGLNNVTASQTGYTFAGWFTEKEGGTQVKSTDTASKAMTLYAHWTINKLTIHYNANGGTLASDSEQYLTDSGDIYSKESQDYVGNKWNYGSGGSAGLMNASTFKLTRTGYTFLGWSLKKSGDTVYDQNDTTIVSQDLYPDLKTKSGTITMYARWKIDVPKTLELRNGDQYTLDYPDEAFTFVSNNTKAAVVSKSGVITAVGEGEAIITLLDTDNNAIQVKLIVLPIMSQGDINLDGEVTVADAVLLHKWLLTVPGTNLPDWEAGDMNVDGELNAVDLTLLKRKLLNG